MIYTEIIPAVCIGDLHVSPGASDAYGNISRIGADNSRRCTALVT
jgi:hypothetical protein